LNIHPIIRRIFASLALLLAAFAGRAHAQAAPGAGTGNSNPPRITLAPPPGAANPPAAASPANTEDIRDLHDLAHLTYWERNGTLIIASSVAGIILFTLTLWLLLRKKPAMRLTPYQVALRKLDAARAMTAEGQDKVFAIAASDAVRDYLEKAYHMPAPERTTEEFLLEAARHAWLRGELAALLRRFLEFCDLAKFAGQQFGPTEREQLLSAASDFLDAAEKNRQPPSASPGNAPAKPTPAPLPPAQSPPKPTLTTS
jgi:hypothetical protein